MDLEYGYWTEIDFSDDNDSKLLILELKLLGVSKDSIKVNQIEKNIEFVWKHPYEAQTKKRVIKFRVGDVNSDNPSFLTDFNGEKFDLFFQKGTYEKTSEYYQYLYGQLMNKKVLSKKCDFPSRSC